MNILYATDSKYRVPCLVSIISLLINNKNAKDLHIYLLADRLKREELLEFRILIEDKYNRQLTVIDAEEFIDIARNLQLPIFSGGYTAYMRFMAEQFIPEDRILYLDCDTLILEDLTNLFNIELSGKVVAQCLDIINSHCNLVLNRSKDSLYFNSGVILFDLSVWKEKNFFSKIAKAVVELDMEKTATGADQDLLNYVLYNQVKVIPLKYNVTSPILYYSSKELYWMSDKSEKDYYSSKEIELAKHYPAIIHFADYIDERPWYLNSIHPYKAIWEGYFNLLEINDYQREKRVLGNRRFIHRIVFKYLPKKLFAYIMRYMYRFKLWKKRK